MTYPDLVAYAVFWGIHDIIIKYEKEVVDRDVWAYNVGVMWEKYQALETALNITPLR